MEERNISILPLSVISCFFFISISNRSSNALLPDEIKPEKLSLFCFYLVNISHKRVGLSDWTHKIMTKFFSKEGGGSLQLEDEGWLLLMSIFHSVENLHWKLVVGKETMVWGKDWWWEWSQNKVTWFSVTYT